MEAAKLPVNFDELSKSTSRYAALPSMKIHYHDVGSGPSLLMLHGAGPGANGWNNFSLSIPELSKRYRLLLIDQPGFGLSDKPVHEEPQHEITAKVLVELLDHLGIDKAIPVANSMGGAAALELALSRPQRVSKLVLMAPAGGSLPIFSFPGRELFMVATYFTQPPSPERMRELVNALAFDGAAMPDQLVQDRHEYSLDVEAMDYSRRMFTALGAGRGLPRHWTRLHEISQPTLLLWGREDRVAPLDNSLHMLRQVKDARLHVVPNCGHWVHIEAREQFEQLVSAFV